MYTFPQQQKIFKDLLRSTTSNKQCADCNTIGPTWASLNFGVFLCSNCSGAHRALGPTITRVKSTKLDQWQKQWMQCMQIGNKELNYYWEADLGMTKKPKMGASQPQLIKYATQKYVKKRFVKDQSQKDPLTRYKNGTYTRAEVKSEPKVQQSKSVKTPPPAIIKKPPPVDVSSNVAVENQTRNVNLIEFEFPEQPKLEVQSQSGVVRSDNRINIDFPQNTYKNPNEDPIKEKSQNQGPQHKSQDDDEFSEYTEHGTSFTATTTQANLTYEQLLAKKSHQNQQLRYNLPHLHHAHSTSSIPHYPSPPSNVNGHMHNVGVNQVHYGNNNLNFKQLYPQVQNPFQSFGNIPVPNQPYNPAQQYNAMYGHQNNQFMNQNSIGMGQNYGYQQAPNSPYLPHNNLQFNNNIMSNPNQHNLNPQGQTLGGYHNQGYGSHIGQGAAGQPQKQPQFKWNDFTGWQGIHQSHHQPQQQQKPATQNPSQPEPKSWLDDWK